MDFKNKFLVTFVLALVIVVSPACSQNSAAQREENSIEEQTGIDALDEIIALALAGNVESLRNKIQYTAATCTNADGLGGPPKCAEGEAEGTLVEVLPFLGPEGHFLRKTEISSWNGVEATRLYAVYQVSESAYSESYMPAGEYALVFLTSQAHIQVTLRIDKGQIVRVDTSFGSSPTIRESDVAEYLIPPAGNSE